MKKIILLICLYSGLQAQTTYMSVTDIDGNQRLLNICEIAFAEEIQASVDSAYVDGVLYTNPILPGVTIKLVSGDTIRTSYTVAQFEEASCGWLKQYSEDGEATDPVDWVSVCYLSNMYERDGKAFATAGNKKQICLVAPYAECAAYFSCGPYEPTDPPPVDTTGGDCCEQLFDFFVRDTLLCIVDDFGTEKCVSLPVRDTTVSITNVFVNVNNELCVTQSTKSLKEQISTETFCYEVLQENTYLDTVTYSCATKLQTFTMSDGESFVVDLSCIGGGPTTSGCNEAFVSMYYEEDEICFIRCNGLTECYPIAGGSANQCLSGQLIGTDLILGIDSCDNVTIDLSTLVGNNMVNTDDQEIEIFDFDCNNGQLSIQIENDQVRTVDLSCLASGGGTETDTFLVNAVCQSAGMLDFVFSDPSLNFTSDLSCFQEPDKHLYSIGCDPNDPSGIIFYVNNLGNDIFFDTECLEIGIESATIDCSTGILELGQTHYDTQTIDLSCLMGGASTESDTLVTGGSFDCNASELTINQTDGNDVVIPFDLSCIAGTESDTLVEAITIDCNTNVLTLDQTGDNDLTVDLSCLVSGGESDTLVTGGSFDCNTGDLLLTQTGGNDVTINFDLSCIAGSESDTLVTGGSFDCNTGDLILTQTGGNDVTIPLDLSCIAGTESDTLVEAITIDCNTNVLTLDQTGNNDLTVDLSCLVSGGESDTLVTGGSFDCNTGDLLLTQTGGNDVTINFDLSCIAGSESDTLVENISIDCNTNILTVDQTGNNDLTLDLSCIDSDEQCLDAPVLNGTVLTLGIENCPTDVTVDLSTIAVRVTMTLCVNGQYQHTFSDGSVQNNAGPCCVMPPPPCTGAGTAGCPCVQDCGNGNTVLSTF